MKSSAIKKAKRRFRQATESLPLLTKLQLGVAIDDFEQAWFGFLGTLNSIPEILKTGSREDAKSRQWFAAKERLVRTDPMLRYLFHARAVDFHGDERLLKLVTSEGTPADVDYGFDSPKAYSLNLHIPKEVQKIRIWYEPQPVKDKNGNIFDPPSTFLQKDLFNRSPVGMAGSALYFYKSLIVEAETFSS
ncbi:hypothetical protein [Mesorhizobium sp. M0701]|uniref:hypothetical protein n=1 Tax=Mesorhizobium sp. M0701 TaxID=2956989 RepID=UPI00333D51FB